MPPQNRSPPPPQPIATRHRDGKILGVLRDGDPVLEAHLRGRSAEAGICSGIPNGGRPVCMGDRASAERPKVAGVIPAIFPPGRKVTIGPLIKHGVKGHSEATTEDRIGQLVGTICGVLAVVDVVYVVHCEDRGLSSNFPNQQQLVQESINRYLSRFPDLHPCNATGAGGDGEVCLRERIVVKTADCSNMHAYLLAKRSMATFTKLVKDGEEDAPLVYYTEADQVLHEGRPGVFAAAAREVVNDPTGNTYVTPQRLQQQAPHPIQKGVWVRDEHVEREKNVPRSPELKFNGYIWSVDNSMGCDMAQPGPEPEPASHSPMVAEPSWLIG